MYLVARVLSLTKVQAIALGRGRANTIILKHHLFLVSQKLEAKEERDLPFGAISYNSLFGEDWRKMTENLAKAEEKK